MSIKCVTLKPMGIKKMRGLLSKGGGKEKKQKEYLIAVYFVESVVLFNGYSWKRSRGSGHTDNA